MPRYVRARQPGGTYFFTVTTRDRVPVLVDGAVRDALRSAIRETMTRWPFAIDAWVLLPDHLHCLWTLPEDDADFSKRWSTIKRLVSQRLDTRFWQPRFWEHLIRDERDRAAHFDYIHMNPVKHGLVQRPVDWPFSTFYRYLKVGVYSEDWFDLRTNLDLE